MAWISAAIFEWDFSDVELLKNAKCSELKLAGIREPSPKLFSNPYRNRSLLNIVDGRHKEWRIRPIFSKSCLIVKWCEGYFGSPNPSWKCIWNFGNSSQTRPVSARFCQSSSMDRDGIDQNRWILLPVYLCGRGITSLESFNSHIKNFIPCKCEGRIY